MFSISYAHRSLRIKKKRNFLAIKTRVIFLDKIFLYKRRPVAGEEDRLIEVIQVINKR